MPYSVFSLKVYRNRNLKSAFCSIEFGYVKEKFHLKISAKAKNSKKIVDSGSLSDKLIQRLLINRNLKDLLSIFLGIYSQRDSVQQ